MNSNLTDTGTRGRYGAPPSTFTSASYARYQPTSDDFVSTFYRHLRQWRFDILTESSIDKALAHPSFRQIVAMGDVVLPLVVDELRMRPDLLVAAMSLLTGADPVRDSARGDMAAMAAAWIDWYEWNR